MSDPLEALRPLLTPALRTYLGDNPDALNRFGVKLPQGLVDKSLEGAPLESGDMPMAGALEAIIRRVGRPPMLVQGDRVMLEPLPDFPSGTDGLIRGVEKWLPSVGRIEFRNHDMSWGGTGWVIEHSDDGTALAVTNRHVAKIVARRRSDGRAVFMRSATGAPYGAQLDFLEEAGGARTEARAAPVIAVDYLADDAAADVALLRLKTSDFDLPAALLLSKKAPKEADLVALIGYPAFDSRNDADDQARYFRDLYEVKRFAPGRIMRAAGDGEILSHDCTSLGGNSGSPLIDLQDGSVVGLHFSGVYGKSNTAVTAATLARLLKGHRPLVSTARAIAKESVEKGHDRNHFSGRQGFDPTVLEVASTPWPGLPQHLEDGLADPGDAPQEPREIRYTHFGVKYHAAKKLPLITAVNIDGARAVRIKRGKDKWFFDDRLPRSIQLSAANFADLSIDRGHMVRREDPNWGHIDPTDPTAQETEARLADGDTFHYVNAAAQHSLLNQGKPLWQGLENYILNSARTHGFRACVFTGPVLRRDDDPEGELVIDGAIAPKEFWKVVVTRNSTGKSLHATAYLLSQGQLLYDLMRDRSSREFLEGFVLGAYRTFQLSIHDLAQATGYDFGAYEAYDPLSQNRRGSAESTDIAGFALESLSDLRL